MTSRTTDRTTDRTHAPATGGGARGARRRSMIGAAALVAVTSVAACGGGDEGSGSTDAPTTTAVRGIFDSDFLVACDGVGHPDAAAYQPAPGEIHPVVVLAGEGPSMYGRSGAVREAWTRTWTADDPTAMADIELVACAEQTAARMVQECTGYEDDGVATGNVVHLMETGYDISLREALTGREVASTTMTMLDDDCPMFVSFGPDEQVTEWYSFDDEAISGWLEPYVTP